MVRKPGAARMPKRSPATGGGGAALPVAAQPRPILQVQKAAEVRLCFLQPPRRGGPYLPRGRVPPRRAPLMPMPAIGPSLFPCCLETRGRNQDVEFCKRPARRRRLVGRLAWVQGYRVGDRVSCFLGEGVSSLTRPLLRHSSSAQLNPTGIRSRYWRPRQRSRFT